MTAIVDDDVLQMFIEESIEHLQDIESDLLEVEQQGENIDEELVNKVFRAAHSIKGGSGFLGLNTIKELAHRIENILDMVRNNELVPDSENINVILKAFDRLEQLINNSDESNGADISEHVVALEGLTSANLADDEKDIINKMITVTDPAVNISFEVTEFDLKHAVLGGKILYILEFDLIHDVQRKNKTPFEILKLLEDTGVILEIEVGLGSVGDLDSDELASNLPMYALFSSIIEPDLMDHTTELDESKIHVVNVDEVLAKPSAPAPKPVVEAPQPIVLETVPEKTPEPEKPKAKAAPKPAPKPKPKAAVNKKENNTKTPKSQSSSGRETLRVPVSVLDQLMNRAGELVLARNQLIQAIETKDMNSLDQAGQRINLVSSELQESIMLTRMQPISVIFSKFPRVVRDMAQDLDKEITLNLEGKEVELDKTIIEGLGDPLTHLVRNSVDHGVEMPDEREQNGKPRTGTILLKAFHESGHVNIVIQDDGKGIDPEKIAAKAVAKGNYTEEQVAVMSDKEKINLIMLPGFSTAEKITDISGRGVGMDVVKTNLDKMGGSVEIDSILGQGTTIKIKLPLTLAIIPSMIVSTDQHRYAIPQVNVAEVLSISPKDINERVKKVGDADILLLRGELIPLLDLSNVLNIKKRFFDSEQKRYVEDRRKSIGDDRIKEPVGDSGQNAENDVEDRRETLVQDINIVIANAGMFKYGLVVDELHDSVEIVVKPLGRHLKALNVYAGATLMGDGQVALILDVSGLAHKAELRSLANQDLKSQITKQEAEKEKTSGITQTLLTFHNGPEEYCAIHLEMVDRVEQIKPEDIEIVGGKKVIQYRGESLPIYALEEVANVNMLEDREDLIVIVFKISGHEFGLLAAPPIDTLDTTVVIDRHNLRQTGIKGSAIINGHTTLIIDIVEFIRSMNPDWFTRDEEEFLRQLEAKEAEAQESEPEVVKEVLKPAPEAKVTQTVVQKPEEVEVPEEEAEPAGPSVTKLLLVEDSDFFRTQVKKFLTDAGYVVHEAEDGQVAWDFLNANPDKVDLVVADLEMPVMDGFELTKRIKAHPSFQKLKVIALTSLAGEDDMEKGKQVGIDDYQIKLDKEKLIESIKAYLD